MSKEIKNALKEAREAIKCKDYKTAIKQIKWVLKEDPENYMGLVLLGAALQDTDQEQASKCFRKASDLNSNNLLAWQGLAGCLEKKSPNEELASVYAKLIQLDKDKAKDVCTKLLSLGSRLKSPEICIKAVLQCLQNVETKDDLIILLYTTFAQLILTMPEVPVEYNIQLHEALSIITKERNIDQHNDFCRRHLKHLYRLQKFEELLDSAVNMHDQYPTDQYPLEWICKIFIENTFDFQSKFTFHLNVDKYVDILLGINDNSSMALLCKSINAFYNNEFVEARDLAIKVNGLRQGWIYCLLTLSMCHCRFGAYNLCEQSCLQALVSIGSMPNIEMIKFKLQEMLITSQLTLENSTKWASALDLCKEILEKDSNNKTILYYKLRAEILLQKLEGVNEIKTLSDYHQTLLKSLILQLRNDLNKALDVLLNAQPILKLTALEESALWVEIGCIYKLKNKIEESLVPFLKAAKFDPYSSDVFYHIGDCYMNQRETDRTGNIERAKKCLQKALQYSPQSPKAGSALSKLYRKNNEWSLNLALLENAVSTSRTSDSKWAWLQLGLHHLASGNHDASIDSLRIVIRIDPNNSQCWESLADAYLNRGSYLSAQKSYLRSLEINPNSIYAKIRIANINQTLGLLDDAIKWYTNVLDIDEDYLLALKGLGETYYLISKQLHNQRLLGLCRCYVQKSLKYLIKAVLIRNNISCLYRLVANCISLVASLPNQHAWLEVPSCLTNKEEDAILKKSELYELATKSFCQSLRLTDNDFIWHELAANYYEHAKYLQQIEVDKNNILNILNKSVAAAKLAIEKSPQKWQHWNLLGCISCDKFIDKPQLAQHCFIEAVIVGQDSAIAWANLATIYLRNGKIVLANKAFKKAQQKDPGYVNSWVGQSYIAQSQNHDETIDLFRHCVQLSFHPEASLAYAVLVCETLKNETKMLDERFRFAIYDMHALTIATDVITWYLESLGWVEENSENFSCDGKPINNKTNIVCALNLLGHLRAMQKLYRSAEVALTTALRLCDNSQKDFILVNLAKVYLKLGNPTTALELLPQVREASYKSACTLAQAYYDAQMYEDCYSTYLSALNWLSEGDHEKSQIIVSMARMTYAFQGPDETKTLLFQCLGLKPLCFDALYATCALGILHKDITLTELILQEFKSYKTNEKYLHNIAYLEAEHYLQQGDKIKARNQICRAIFQNPRSEHQSKLRLMLGTLLIDHFMEKLSVSALMAESALLFERKEKSREDVANTLAMVSKSRLLTGDIKKSLRWAQISVFTAPNSASAWSTLSAALIRNPSSSKDLTTSQYICKTISFIRRHLEPPKTLNQWLSTNERKMETLVKSLS